MLASFTTPLHSLVCWATKSRNSPGVLARDEMLSCLKRSATSGKRSASLSEALSFVTIGAGVPCGTNTPFHSLASKPGIVSDTGGISGRLSSRPWPVCAIAFTLPPLIKPTTDEPLEKKNFLPRHYVGERDAAAAIGHVVDLDAGLEAKHFQAKMLQ